MSAFTDALRAATTDGDALAAIAKGIDPDATAPTPEALAAWYRDEAPKTAREEAEEAAEAFHLFTAPEDVAAPGLLKHLQPLVRTFPEGPGVLAWRVRSDGKAVAHVFGPRSLSLRWLAARADGFKGCHPLGPVVRAWFKRPRTHKRDRKRAGRYPVRLAQARGDWTRKGSLPPLVGDSTRGKVQYSLLPGLGSEYDEYGGEFLAAALPVELYRTPGKGAPLDVRLGLEAILDLKPHERNGQPRISDPALKWGHWLQRVYPSKDPKYLRRNRAGLWPGLARAIENLEADPRWKLAVSNGRGGFEAVRVVSVVRHPLTGHDSERMQFVVTAPEGREGSVQDRRIIRLAGEHSTAALALASGLGIVWDQPGDLRQQGPNGWEQTAAPGAYPLIGWRGIASLMYPGGWPKRKRWPQVEAEARALLDWLQSLGYVLTEREPGGRRIMPGPDWPGWTPDQRRILTPWPGR